MLILTAVATAAATAIMAVTILRRAMRQCLTLHPITEEEVVVAPEEDDADEAEGALHPDETDLASLWNSTDEAEGADEGEGEEEDPLEWATL